MEHFHVGDVSKGSLSSKPFGAILALAGVQVMKLKKVDIKERDELEPMLVNDLSVIEDGMRVVAHQLATTSGPLDILAVDEDGTLALLELKNEVDEDEDPLTQGLRYYDWVFENRAWIGNIYKELAVDPLREPRLLVVAPGFPLCQHE